LSHLRGLILPWEQISDAAGLGHIKGLTNLETLHLFGPTITDAGLESIQSLTNLKMLELARTSVSDAGLKKLGGLEKLMWLDLQQTNVTLSDQERASKNGL
jgi:internalin A